MRTGQWKRASAVLAALALAAGGAGAAEFEFQPGDTVAIIGNALPDRMQHDGWLETYLQKANADQKLVIRNMAFTGDQVAPRPRNEGFTPAHDYLAQIGADVVLAFFGYNEAFDHDPEKFKTELGTFIEETRAKRYNGESAPRLVLFSPVAFEDLKSPNFPDGEEINRWLSAYTDAMASVARRMKVPFVDLYYPTAELFENTEAPLTINGVHLNEAGNRAVAEIIARELNGDVDLSGVDALRAAVLDKNWCWFNRYRATDGNDVWGSRAPLAFVDGQTNREVLQHELTMLDLMTANRDKVIWAAAKGKSLKPDDSNVPDPVMVATNLEPAPDKRDDSGGHKFVRPEDGTKTFTLDKGLQANLFASEEMFEGFVNPVQLDVDTKGRLWAAVWQTYPKWQPDQPMLDRLVILPDADRDGVADKMITFAYIHNPTGFTFWNGGVIVASAPNLWFLKDTDGDDVADHREVLLGGLDSADTHHAANGFDYGPDGYLYYQSGIFLINNVETPWQTAQLSGASAMFRFNPRTHRYSFHAMNPPNPHGGDFDYWGYHYATSATGGEAYQIREDGGGKFKMHPLLNKTVRPVPSSGIISSGQFPEEYQGNFIILNSIGFLGIKRYTLKNTDGVVWGTETDDLLVSSDSNFRPTDFKFGDDGAMYVSDWSNPIIGHMQHNVRDPNRDHEHGRIYRLIAEGRPLQEHVEIDGQPVAALLEALKHPVDGVRLRARIELSERPTADVIAAAREWVKQFDAAKQEDAHHLLEALWLHQQHNVVDEDLLGALLKSPEPHAQRAAQRVKYLWDIEGKFAPKAAAAAPAEHHAHTAESVLQEARDYLKQEQSPPPRMDGDTLELHIQTLKEQMRYDRKEFTVVAGMKVRLVFSNPDAMDHNLIMVEQDSAGKVAVAAMKMEQSGEGTKKQWKPEVEGILFASRLLRHGESQELEFTAPAAPGIYEYLCTFPGHWQLMRGVMKVVPRFEGDLLAANALKDEATLATGRKMVAMWTLDMIKSDIAMVSAKRSLADGQRMFQIAGCTQCHDPSGAKETVGPDLREVGTRYPAEKLLEHILDPSLEVADDYKTYVVELRNDKELYGQVKELDGERLRVLEDPLKPESAVVVARGEVRKMDPIAVSPMPTDLLNTLNKNEILDLLAYLIYSPSPARTAAK